MTIRMNKTVLSREERKAKRDRKFKLRAKGKVWITDNLIEIRKNIKPLIKELSTLKPRREEFSIKLKGYDDFDVNRIVELNAIKYSDGYQNVKGDQDPDNYYPPQRIDRDFFEKKAKDGITYHKRRFRGSSYQLEFVKLINRFLEDFEFTIDDIEYIKMAVVDGHMEIASGMGATFVSFVYWDSWVDFISTKPPMNEKDKDKFWDIRKQARKDGAYQDEKDWYEIFDN